MKWTVVQHSGYGYAGKPDFEHAVEAKGVSSKAEERRVEKAGGALFGSYEEATKFEETANYPPDVRGLVPHCKGTFSELDIDGLKIYVPVREIKG